MSLGNHEADLPVDVLKARLDELAQRGRIVVLNTNVNGLRRRSRELDVVRSSCGRIRVGLLGMLSDESGMFRDGTFRGMKITKVKESYDAMAGKVATTKSADCLVPLTHQSLNADVDFAKWMLNDRSTDGTKRKRLSAGVILGGHEHVKIHEHVHGSQGHGDTVQIVKSGQDSERAAVIDLLFNASNKTLETVNVHFEELDERYDPCPITNIIVSKHLLALEQLQDFVLFDTTAMLSEYFTNPTTGERIPLSSEYTRYEQTTVGGFFCTAIKSELGVDVCVINGAPIKASTRYSNGTMSYDDLRNELPFPLKMIIVEMTCKQLREAITYSRENIEKGKTATTLEDGRIERRGYLQTDFDWEKSESSSTGDQDDDKILTVALPRNLLKG